MFIIVWIYTFKNVKYLNMKTFIFGEVTIKVWHFDINIFLNVYSINNNNEYLYSNINIHYIKLNKLLKNDDNF